MRSLNIQGLRAVAALGIVVHHLNFYLVKYVAAGSYDELPEVLAAGVDIFFVLSGYLMAQTALRRGEPGSFMRARIARIVPLYWSFTLAVAVSVAAGFHTFGVDDMSVQKLVEALFFLPPSGPSKFPPLYVGWTLNYEMLFYALFALCLWVPSEKGRLTAFFCMLGVLQVAGLVSESRYLQYWGAPLAIEFALGVGLFLYARVYVFSARRAWTCIVVACGLIGLTEWVDVVMEEYALRFLLWGIPAAMIVYSAICLEKHGKYFDSPKLTFLGDASYSIYLFHPFALQVIGKLSLLTGLHGTVLLDAASVVCAATAALGGGALVHTQLERPLNEWLRRRRDPVRSAHSGDHARVGGSR